MVVINAYSVSSTSYTQDVFGGNILATRDTLGEGSSFESVAEQLNITSFRYPGGSISEHYFDITNPNATSAPHTNGVDTVNLLTLGEFFGFLEENSYAASLVIPTRTYLSEATDALGNRFAAVDEEALRGFINDVLDGVYGLVAIDAFEIGNEYWNSGGMTSLEYGRVATEMCAIIHDALAGHPSYEALFSTPRVLVQMGADYGYADLGALYTDVGDGAAQLAAFNADYGFSFGDEYIYGSGKVKWSFLANEIIIREFENSASLDNVDGVVAHVYSRGPELPSSRYFSVRTIDNSWGNYIDDLFVHITEWNQSAATRALDHEEDFGLLQAHEMLNILEVFADYEVGCARVWPLQQNTANDLSGDAGQTELTVPGHMFALMSEHLMGTRPIQLNPDMRQPEDEVSADGADIHAFYAADRLVIFIASTSESGADLTLNLRRLISEEVEVNVSILGVVDGQNPTDTSSAAELNNVNSNAVYQNQNLSLNLDSYEIALIEIEEPTYTDAFLSLIEETDPNKDDAELTGTAGEDSLVGSDGVDQFILGLGGGDQLRGGDSNNQMVGDSLQVAQVLNLSDQVYRLYGTALGREPDSNGHLAWVTRLFRKSWSLQEAADGFAGSQEFSNTYDNLDDNGFVELLYQNVLGRASDGSGLFYWTGQLAAGASRGAVVLGFSESLEYVRSTAQNALDFAEARSATVWADDVYRLYRATLGRDPDAGGFDSWMEQLGNGASYLNVAKGFIASREFDNTYGTLNDSDFVELLYQNVLGRASDATGKQSWLDLLDDGGERVEVVRGFAQSAEFIAATAAALTDFVRGLGGGDHFTLDTGNNRVVGGAYADEFLFSPGTGATHEIWDFEAWDQLALSGFGYGDTAAVLAAFEQVGDDVVLNAQDSRLTLIDTDLALLSDDNVSLL